MCGIAGFVGSGTRTDLERMTQALVHRGPDDAGFHVSGAPAVHLGFRRLAIVDIAGGRQPMANETGDVHVIYNGEIYNHLELRDALIAQGHRFASDHSDTEVLVHGWEEWGEDLPRRLNGMFAFAIHDARRRQLFLARDRFGEKPLYHAAISGGIAFASELSSLARHPGVLSAIDPVALAKLFAYGFVPAPYAMLQGTRKLIGGSWLRHSIDSGETEIRPYWRFAIEADEALGDRDEMRLVDELESLIAQAARRRLMSDVPLGVFLSGGVDSSTVLAALGEGPNPPRVQTFTIGFNEPSFDESDAARVVANHLGSQHDELRLDLDVAKSLIPEVLRRLDEPLGDSSIIPTALLCRFAREHVTVALSGDGGDELFAGYDPFLALGPAGAYDRIMPRFAHRGLMRIADLMPISDRNMGLDFKLRRTLKGLDVPESVRIPTWMAPLDRQDLTEALLEPVDADEIFAEAVALWLADPRKSRVDRALEYFTNFYLRDDILTKVDRVAMMFSLETRAVFLDNDVVEFCRRLPSRFKLRRGERKYLLKQVAKRHLPLAVVDRPKKGFGMPVSKWLRSMTQPSLDVPAPGINREWMAQAWREHVSGRRDHRLVLWTWLGLEAFASATRLGALEVAISR